MSEMVERLAKIAASISGEGDGRSGESLARYVELSWDQHVADARKIIAAMREPSDEMKTAGSDRIGGITARRAGVIWQAMIDEALK